MPLDPVTSNLFTGQSHGFFGRKGGVSQGLFFSLNCGYGSGDAERSVMENRQKISEYVNIPDANLLFLQQIHSNQVVVVDTPNWPDRQPKADAMVSALPDIGLGILTADCAPVLFSDPDQKIIGAAHAGWKGAASGIIGNTIDAMINLGAKRENIRAVIGPTISQQSYEVGQEFFENFYDDNTDNARFFINGKAGKYLFDLPDFVITDLNAQKIHSAEWVKKCTYTFEKEYFSYRRATHRNEPDYGRQISVITNSFR
ncbi:MAG: peptidoglycan editing factor PgeF [Rhodobacteraceae bacterium]|nr:peptidoglycan editing factor PgeF [Paracoccaceae bacterium]